MKYKAIAILLLVSSITFSQTLEKLKAETQKIYSANYNMDFDAVVSLSYPKMISDYGKEKFLEKLDSDYQNDEYRMREQLESLPFQFGAIQKIGDKSFCVVTYRNPKRFFFENKLNAETAIQKAEMLKEYNQTQDVTFERKRNSYNVRRMSKFIAVADETTGKEWRFFNGDDSVQRQAFETIFGSELKKQFGL